MISLPISLVVFMIAFALINPILSGILVYLLMKSDKKMDRLTIDYDGLIYARSQNGSGKTDDFQNKHGEDDPVGSKDDHA